MEASRLVSTHARISEPHRFGVVVCLGAVMPWIGLFVGLAWMLILSITELVVDPATMER